MLLTMELVKDTEECVRWKQGRGWVYQLLIDFLGSPPSLSLVAQWRQHMVTREEILLTEGGQLLKNYLSNIMPGQLVKICEVEKEEYQRLFHCMRPIFRSLCESDYVSRLREKKVDCTANVREMYVQSGIAFNKLNHEQDDNISLELEYMAILAERTSDDRRIRTAQLELIDDQIRFLDEHLIQWIPTFGEDLMCLAQSSVYTAIGSILRDFIPYDMIMLRSWRENLS
ncbi:TorD/DmsD family molecular chaperone [Paenibacillus sp. FA6]|uniref:TorD/DmsD family molecular chaperone n=1 Tax=Paenibacillus sp. FA6 TaxID=3413029 RepID=UPI003F654CDF